MKPNRYHGVTLEGKEVGALLRIVAAVDSANIENFEDAAADKKRAWVDGIAEGLHHTQRYTNAAAVTEAENAASRIENEARASGEPLPWDAIDERVMVLLPGETEIALHDMVVARERKPFPLSPLSRAVGRLSYMGVASHLAQQEALHNFNAEWMDENGLE